MINCAFVLQFQGRRKVYPCPYPPLAGTKLCQEHTTHEEIMARFMVKVREIMDNHKKKD